MKGKLKIISFLGFLLAFHFALISYINSSFLSSFIDEGKVGLIYTVGAIGSILALLVIPKVLRVLGAYKFLVTFSFLTALGLFLLSVVNTPVSVGIVFIAYFAISSLVTFLLDELVQIFSEGSSMGWIRGLYLTSINLAWVVAQLVSGRILAGTDFPSLYFIASLILLLILLISLVSFRDLPDPKYSKLTVVKSVKEYMHSKNLKRAYKMNFLLQFFYSWMVIYTPIYLSQHLGFTWEQISVIFTIKLLPFVLIQLPLGYYSDKTGERKMLMYGFFIMSAATFSLFFVNGNNMWIWAAVLFITRLGAATIEIMCDVYFFKHINKENDELIGIYRNTGPMAYIVGPLIASGLFYLIPSFKFIFLILGAVILYGVYIASTIRKSDI